MTRIFAASGAYQTPLADVKDRIERKARGQLKARPRKERDAWEVGDGHPVQTVKSQV